MCACFPVLIIYIIQHNRYLHRFNITWNPGWGLGELRYRLYIGLIAKTMLFYERYLSSHRFWYLYDVLEPASCGY